MTIIKIVYKCIKVTGIILLNAICYAAFFFTPIVALVLISFLLNYESLYNKVINGDVGLLFFVSLSVLYIVVISFWGYIFFIKDKYHTRLQEVEKEKDTFKNDLQKKFTEKEIKLQLSTIKKENEISHRENIVKGFVNSLDKEKYCAELISDFRTILYEETSRMLGCKFRSAPKAATIVRQLKVETKKCIEELKEYKYKERERISSIETLAQQKVSKANTRVILLEKACEFLEERLHDTAPFHQVAELYSDALSIAYEEIAQNLRERVRPANSRADTIERELKKKIREVAYDAKLLKYRWDYLISIFPDMEHYVYDDSSLISMAGFDGVDDFNNNVDKAHEYLSDEEYNSRSEIEKYQLSLDRYKERRRHNAWIAGAEYEMFCSYYLREKGFYVVENGIRMRKADMGRDIIARKDDYTYIVQCKRYSLYNNDGTKRYLHENVVCQLYGTTIEYQIANSCNSLFSMFEKIKPLLITTGELSDMAKAFAKRLDVEVEHLPMGEYPMIKCNINNGEKIYHLPFDQQYWHTMIEESKGEFFAWTVQEAYNAGFRRAKRWMGNT